MLIYKCGWDVRVLHTGTRVTKNRLNAAHYPPSPRSFFRYCPARSLSLIPSRVPQYLNQGSAEDSVEKHESVPKIFSIVVQYPP